MRKHFVTFFSPGTIVAEQTTKEIDGWNVDEAVRMSETIVERYGSVPYGFRFTTRERNEDEWSSRVVEKSGMYYINCVVNTLEELESINNPDDQVLVENMKTNGYNKVATTKKGFKWSWYLHEDDVVLG